MDEHLGFQFITLKDLSGICINLGDLAEKLLPLGSLAMIRKGAGETFATRSGIRVLLESSPNHPLGQVIINAVTCYHKETGDGCKQYLILLKDIVRDIQRKFESSDDNLIRVKLIAEISTILRHLHCIFEFLQKELTMVSYSVKNSDVFVKDMESLTFTYFRSKFSSSVSETLSKLLCNFICGSIVDWCNIQNIIDYVLPKFDILCSKVSLPVHDSYVVFGIVLNQPFFAKNISSLDNLNFVILKDVSLAALNESTLSIEYGTQVHNLCSFAFNHYSNYLNMLKKLNVNLLLTKSMASDDLKSSCLQTNVYLVDKLSEEEFNLIQFYFKIQPMSSFNEIVDPENIGNADFIKPLLIGQQEFIHMKTSLHSKFYPQHIMLCAHLDSIWKEYYTECHNCLKVINHWILAKNHYEPNNKKKSDLRSAKNFCTGNEQFKESCVCNKMQNFNVEYFNFKLYFLPKNKILESTLQQSLDSATVMAATCSLGLWEILFKSILTEVYISNSNQKLYFVPSLIAALNYSICKKLDISVHDYHTNLEKCYCEYIKRLNYDSRIPLEPVKIKEILIYHVLCLVMQLLKVDGICNAK